MADFKPGDVIWVKCGQLFWPAQVQDFKTLPEDVKEDLDEAKLPKVIAKFFDEDGYEFLFDTKNVYDYNCPKKEEFIKKGVVRSRQKSKEGAKGGWYAKFPEDVVKCEKITGGDVNILEKDPFVERAEPRINYKELFGTPGSEGKKGKGKKGQQKASETPPPAAGNRKRKATSNAAAAASSPKKRAGQSPNPRPIVHPRFRAGGSGSDHQVKILPQPSAPYHLDLQMKQEKTVPSNAYTCHVCGFSATRLNVIVLHQKSHSEPPSANQKKPTSKARNSSAASPASSRPTKKSIASNGAVSSGRSRKPPAKKSTETPHKEQNQESTPKKQKAGPASHAYAVEKKTVTKDAASASSPVPSGKKKRLTKKQKIEQEKKKEERDSILDEWGDDEEDETEEKKKINESMGKASDMSDNSDGEGYLGDDNLHGFDDDDEEMPKPEEEEEEVDDKEEDDKKDDDKRAGDKNGEASPKRSDEDQNNDEKQNDLVDDIGKILEETKVPDLPPVESLSSEKKPKRGVKFSEQLDRELKQKKMALVEHPSNLEIPDEVEDEFAESTNEESTTRPILKKPGNDAANPSSDDEQKKAKREEEQKSKDETVSSLLALGNAEVVKDTALKAHTRDVALAGNAAAATVVANPQAGANSDSVGEQEETYILLVDENSSQMVDSLNSQVLYLDSNSLANGNVVLMTGNDGSASNGATIAENNGTASSVQAVNKDDVPSTKEMAATASVSESVSVVTEPVIVAEAPAAP